MKLRRVLKTNETEQTDYTDSKSKSTQRRRIVTEIPTNDWPLPHSYDEYVQAQWKVNLSNIRYQQMKSRGGSRAKSLIKNDWNKSFIIRQGSFSSNKYLHKCSMELDSPMFRYKPQQVKPEFKIVQSALGTPSLGKDWDKRWESLFETYFRMQELKSQDFNWGSNQPTKQLDLKWLQQELSKQNPDFRKVDELLRENQFFSRYPWGVRMGLIENSSLITFKMDELILSKSLNNDMIFIILRGSCKMQVRCLTSFNEQVDVVGNSFYEGQHFGAKNLVSELTLEQLQKQNANAMILGQPSQYLSSEVFAQEDCLLLRVGSAVFDNVVIKLIEPVFNAKVKVLKKVKLLKGIDINPVAALLKVSKYGYADIVIEIGAVIDRIYFVGKGRVKSLISYTMRRELINHNINQNQSDLHIFPSKCITNKNIRYGNKVNVNNKYLQYTHHKDIQQYQVGDLFGCSSLLQESELANVNKYKHNHIAQLQILADTANTEIYTIEIAQIVTLPEPLRYQLVESLKSIREYDDIDIEAIQALDQRWEILKQSNYKSHYIRKMANKS